MRKSKNVATSSLLGSALALLLLAAMPGCVGSADENSYGDDNWDTDTYYDEIEEEWDTFHEDDYYDYDEELEAGVPDDEGEVADWTDGDEHWRLYATDNNEHNDECVCKIEDDYYQSFNNSEVCRYEDGQIYNETPA